MNILGFYGRYLLVEAKSLPSQLLPKNHQIPTGIVWVDLSAVEARVQFDNLIQHSQKIPLSQGLLIPMTVSLSRADAQLLEENLEIAQKLGLQLRVAGQSAFLIEAIPPFLEEGEIGKILEELIAELHGLERENTKELEKLRRLAACISKRVKSRKRPYGLTEARIFVQRLTESSDPFHCPYGRSTLFYISEEEIENYFAPKKR
jgi:DNA mismatch repair protein MutL